MLDLNHPRTPHVFAAARQLDLIYPAAKICTVASGNHRQHQLFIMQPVFAARRWLDSSHFDASTEINDAIANLESAFSSLDNRTLPESTKHATELSNCPVCESKITECGTYNPPGTKITVPAERYCESCVAPIFELLDQCGTLFGTGAI